MSEAEFYKALSEFLSEKHGEPIVVDAHTDLLASGAVDSLIMVEILMLIESLSDRPVDPDALEPELFEQCSRLYGAFFKSSAEELR